MDLEKDWKALANKLCFNGKAFINGQYTDSASANYFDAINPANGEVLCQVSRCGENDLDKAVTAARNSFTQKSWSQRPVQERKQVLLKVAELIMSNRDELALLESLDMGKNIRDSYNIDIPKSAESFTWYAEAIDKVYGQISPSTHNGLGTITSEPLGVVAAIVPWNFPLLMASWKLAPALATGNSVILKPSERSSLTAIKLAEIMKEAGIPDGVFNVLPGLGHEIGKAIGLHNDIDCVVFTGSTATGKRLMEYAGQSNLKKVYTECGGKSPNIIFDDYKDIEKLAAASANAIFFNQGEVCVAGSRLLVHQSLHDTLVEKLLEQAKKMQPGNPLEIQHYMGPLVDKAHLDRVMNYISQAQEEGATLKCGGEALLTETGGSYVGPTIFTGVTPDMTIFNEEVFGPVLSITAFDTEEEAIELANHGCFGLAAGLWTDNLSRAHRAARSIRAGSVWVNCWSGGDLTMPFGGYKQSGNGRDKALQAMEKFTETKSTFFSFQ